MLFFRGHLAVSHKGNKQEVHPIYLIRTPTHPYTISSSLAHGNSWEKSTYLQTPSHPCPPTLKHLHIYSASTIQIPFVELKAKYLDDESNSAIAVSVMIVELNPNQQKCLSYKPIDDRSLQIKVHFLFIGSQFLISAHKRANLPNFSDKEQLLD